MNSKEERRRALVIIENLEFTVSNAQRWLKAAQHDYLLFLGFTYESESDGFLPVNIYSYEDELFTDIDHAIEYADEHI